MTFESSSMLYNLFLSMATIVIERFEGVVVKNIGDALLFYFKPKNNKDCFCNLMRCCGFLLNIRETINAKLFEHGLPKVSYRINADYGKVMLTDTRTSFNKDIFGSPVNICVKMKFQTNPNQMVIGHDLYQFVKTNDCCNFVETQNSCLLGNKQAYPLYSVKFVN